MNLTQNENVTKDDVTVTGLRFSEAAKKLLTDETPNTRVNAIGKVVHAMRFN